MVEWDGLENRCTGNRTVGSNPTLSAKYFGFISWLGDATLVDWLRYKARSIRICKPIANLIELNLFSQCADGDSGDT